MAFVPHDRVMLFVLVVGLLAALLCAPAPAQPPTSPDESSPAPGLTLFRNWRPLVLASADAPAPPAAAPCPAPAPTCPPVVAPAPCRRRSEIALYGWLSGIHADVGARGVEATVDASISDVLHHFKGGGSAHYESGGSTTVVLDVLYAKLGGTVGRPEGPLDFTVKQWLVEAGVTLGRMGTEQKYAEWLLGGRYFSISTSLSFSPQNVSGSGSKSWAEPFVGGRYGTALSDKWRLTLTGNVGGFGIGSDLTWEAVATFRYALNPTTDLGIGYRYLNINYDKSNFEFDGTMAGPVIGVAWAF